MLYEIKQVKFFLGHPVDGESVNMGIHAGLGAKVRETAPWLVLVHGFNHRIELAMKDVFGASAFSKIDHMLQVLHSLYNASPKRYTVGRGLADINSKMTKATGTCWTEHKVNAMIIALESYGAFFNHIESLSESDSNPAKQAELQGYFNKWKDAAIPIYLAIYLDILSPIPRLSLGLQQELHGPVKAVPRIQEFSWTMVKLRALIDKSLNDPTSKLTHYKQFLSELETNENDETFYQGIPLARFDIVNNDVEKEYAEIITQVASNMVKRFQDLHASPVFTHITSILDVSVWPKELNDDISYGDSVFKNRSSREKWLQC